MFSVNLSFSTPLIILFHLLNCVLEYLASLNQNAQILNFTKLNIKLSPTFSVHMNNLCIQWFMFVPKLAYSEFFV